MKKLILLATVLLGFWLGLTPTTAVAWGSAGHMVCAQIAYERLEPEVRAEADRLIAVLADLEPVNRHFVTASVWLDQLRGDDVRLFDTWHYINLPFNAGGLQDVPAAQSVNVISQTREAAKTLGSPDAGDFGKAFALRTLLHLVGDIHQPLHTIGRVTQAYPNGDRGGNDFSVSHPDPAITNLHRLWDSTLGLLPRVEPEGEWQAPVRQHASDVVDATLPALQGTDPEAISLEFDPDAWARESYQLAIHVAYQGIEEDGTPSADYVSRGQRVAGQRMTLAGLRLAALLNHLLGPKADSP